MTKCDRLLSPGRLVLRGGFETKERGVRLTDGCSQERLR